MTTFGPTGALRRLWSARVPGAVYGAPVAAAGLVVVGTERDVVAAFDAGTGAPRWSTSLGTPVAGSALPCGDLSPSGITGTPAIDPAAGVVHVVAFLAPAHHELVTIDLATGTVRSRVAVDPPGLDPTVEQERGGLTVANGRVYVPFGGLFGDCGAYKGAVVAVPSSVADAPGAPGAAAAERSWVVPVAREGGIWSPAGVVVGTDGAVWVATGNAGTGPAFDDGDAVVRLDADLRPVDRFAPADWVELAEADRDLGSSSPTLLAGAVVQAGKAGDAYVLDPGHLGGIGGQRAKVHACDSVFSGTATVGALVLLPCRDGVAALEVGVDRGTFTVRVVWHGPSFDAGAPVVAGTTVWVPDLGTGDLVGLDDASGAVRERVHVGDLPHFATVGLGAGHLLTGTTDGMVSAFG